MPGRTEGAGVAAVNADGDGRETVSGNEALLIDGAEREETPEFPTEIRGIAGTTPPRTCANDGAGIRRKAIITLSIPSIIGGTGNRGKSPKTYRPGRRAYVIAPQSADTGL